MKPGRNDPCWCGSGRKFKRCHGWQPAKPTPPVPELTPEQKRTAALKLAQMMAWANTGRKVQR